MEDHDEHLEELFLTSRSRAGSIKANRETMFIA
jgi:hypothetical protein